MKVGLVLLAAAGLYICGSLVAGEGYEMSWSTIDGGGRVSVGGSADPPTYELTGTIGQADANPGLGGGGYFMTGGFWVVAPSLPCDAFAVADFNRSCTVDADDYVLFLACLTGPGVPYKLAQLPAGCELVHAGDVLPADFDADGDVDQADFGVFQKCYSGRGQLADPGCAD